MHVNKEVQESRFTNDANLPVDNRDGQELLQRKRHAHADSQ